MGTNNEDSPITCHYAMCMALLRVAYAELFNRTRNPGKPEVMFHASEPGVISCGPRIQSEKKNNPNHPFGRASSRCRRRCAPSWKHYPTLSRMDVKLSDNRLGQTMQWCVELFVSDAWSNLRSPPLCCDIYSQFPVQRAAVVNAVDNLS